MACVSQKFLALYLREKKIDNPTKHISWLYYLAKAALVGVANTCKNFPWQQ